MDAMNALVDTLLVRMLWTSVQAIGLIGVVYLLGRLLPQLSAAMRCTLWWLVGAQLLLGLLWHAPLELQLLPAAPVAVVMQVAHPVATLATITAGPHPAVYAAATTATPSWRTVVVLLWLAALLWQASRTLREWGAARQVLRTSQPVRDDALQQLCVRKARQLGLRCCPQLRFSDAIVSPQVIGLWRPTVLLPAHDTLTAAESAMALAHELVHVRRGDLWLGWIPALAQWLFCFHPLVRWAMREYALNRESACDALVVQHDQAAPQDYGRLLLRLGVAQPVHAGLAGASPSFHNLKRRLTMLQETVNQPPSRARGWLLVAAIALIGVLPYRVTAADNQHDNTTPPAASASAKAPMARVPAVPPAPPMNPAALPPPPPPMSPPPPPPPPPHDNGFYARHVNIDTTNSAENGFALFDGNSMITINGSNADVDTVRKLHAANKSMLWFRRGHDAYLIRDKAMLERASRIYAPVTALAQQQGKLAGEQGAAAGRRAGLAAQDAALAQQQAELARRQAELAARVATGKVTTASDAERQAALASLQVQVTGRAATGKATASDAEQRTALASLQAQLPTGDAARSDAQARQNEVDAQRAEMDAAQAQLDKHQAELDARLGAQQQVLETQQAGFEKQQQAMERQQEQAQHAADQSMSQLLDEALAKGLAQKTSQR
jgi:bla regulator protein BlaR1